MSRRQAVPLRLARRLRTSPWWMRDFPAARRRTFHARSPNTSGCPGWTSTRSKKNCAPRSASTRSTISYFPAETPPDSSRRSDSKPCSIKCARRFVVVARDRQNPRIAACPGHLHGHRPGVRIADLEGLRLLARLDDLVARRQDRDARPAIDRRALAADHRQQRDFGEAQPPAWGKNDAAVPGFDPLRVEILAGS